MIYVESEIQYKWAYQQNRKRLSDVENRLVVAKGEGRVRGMDQEFGITRHKLLYTEWINDKILLYGTEHYIQYPVIMEKNTKKNAYIHLYIYVYVQGFPGGAEVKASACNVGELGLILGSGRSPGEGNGNPLQYSCLENPMDGGAWWAIVHGSQRVGHN